MKKIIFFLALLHGQVMLLAQFGFEPTTLPNVKVCEGGATSFGFRYISTSSGIVYTRWQYNAGGLWRDMPTSGNNALSPLEWSGESTITLQVKNVPLSMQGWKFRCKVWDASNTAYSNEVAMTVNSLPVVTWISDETISVCEEAPVQFKVDMNSTRATAEWEVKTAGNDWQKITSGATASRASRVATLEFSLASIAQHQANYRCQVSLDGCTATTQVAATLLVRHHVKITQTSPSESVCPDTPFSSISVEVSDTENYPTSYQWYATQRLNEVPAAGYTNSPYVPTSSVLTISNGMEAAYKPYSEAHYFCVAKGSCGYAISQVVSLTYKNKLAIEKQPTDQMICPGKTFADPFTNLNERAEITPSISWSWYKVLNEKEIPPAGFTSKFSATGVASMALPASTWQAGKYIGVAQDECGFSVSEPFTFSYYSSVKIAEQPQSKTICYGEPFTFSVKLIDNIPCKFQWYRNQTKLAGFSGITCAYSSSDETTKGVYMLQITDVCMNTLWSMPASLQYHEQPSVVTNIEDKLFCPEQSTGFNFLASSTVSDIAYQWQLSYNGTEWQDVQEDDNVKGSKTNQLNIQHVPREWNGMLFRNKYKQKEVCPSISYQSAEARLVVVTGNPTITASEHDIPYGTPVRFICSGDTHTTASWDFGDYENSNEKNPTHIYNKAGEFVVSLVLKSTRMECQEIVRYGSIYVRGKDVSLYPNPMRERATISSIFDIQSIEIADLTGKQYEAVIVSQQPDFQINTEALPLGTFIINVFHSHGKTSLRAMKH